MSDKSIKIKQDFYDDNYPDFPEKIKKDDEDNVTILTYNVNGFINQDDNIEILDNFKLIKKMIVKFNPDVFVLQEVGAYGKFTIDYIIKQFTKCGYDSYGYTPCCNLIKQNKKFMIVMSKKNVKSVLTLDLSVGNISSGSICIKFGKTSFIALHLNSNEDASELNKESDEYAEIIYNNSLRHCHQIETVLNGFDDASFMIGDFNFSIDDDEFKYLTENKKYIWDENRQNTTALNRTDFVFVKQNSGIEIVKSMIIKCNYSTHLPVFCELGFIKDDVNE